MSEYRQQFLFVFLLITLSATFLRSEHEVTESDRFVVWNIGQGQWTTLITRNYCDHFDMGGEYNISRKILGLCGHRQHRLHLSHWDWDHMGLLQNFRRRNIPICLWNYPLGPASERKLALLAGIPKCETTEPPFQSIFAGDSSVHATSNDTSQVVQTHKILIPGDSTNKEERTWSLKTELAQSRGLILGHHGSRSSTSELLLEHLPKLKWAVATARKHRYGHPHAEVVARLRAHRIPLIKTEDWGNLMFEIE